ncbi:5-methyltetrahydropteroyltriglutamate--homocysteine S-methyltransferase [Actinokineospora cianjurensis]|uniref:5-methyltetrahydropteroyltriglutamate--homocysteine methyltransferase n=1 Tax=Actinokineospora cianjurensis TaxID=585224 RepID=A0A421B2F2_9PSEU|nr:5-methyltetrahydropteroyltriglutamate--homocysteine S-methyltransferase [Actinokineospora cianjurensis]RLK58525.1 methionine synthase (B12-independent) [Actinokineospora cianjurensis]
MNVPIGSTVLGYPRIGGRRELKRAVERYWSGRLDEAGLHDVAAGLRAQAWRELSGLDSVPGNTFSYYDQVLDTAVLFDAIPARHRDLGLNALDTYFAMARGTDEVTPLEMTKWFDTNYHYLVPEVGPDTRFALTGDKPVAEYREAASLGIKTRPVLVGPVTFLLLAKPSADAPADFAPLSLLDGLVEQYAELLETLRAAGVEWVQLDEPAFVADRTPDELAALQDAYYRLSNLSDRPNILVAGYFGDWGEALPVLAESSVEAVSLDLVAAPEAIERVSLLHDKIVVAGLVEGRNVWRTDLHRAAELGARIADTGAVLAVSTSCSLLHVPLDLDAETDLAPEVRSRLAFAKQKVDEVVRLGRVLLGGESADLLSDTAAGTATRDEAVRARLAEVTPEHRTRVPYPDRADAQESRLRLPALATTTIGSFPQTGAVRQARADLRTGAIDEAGYEQRMREEVERVIRLQEEIGLDVLVHGEPERNDMVQYFAERLDGFAHTELGWVQSYGSRCVRPPILHSDLSRPAPMTVRWAEHAQSLTPKPVKGMLTGPVTILAWSFVRTDQPLADTADQVALALRDEVADLEAAGIGIIQVDEPALRETLPLRERDRKAYLDWAVGAFRLATGGAAPWTQVHTHLCYSEFGDVIHAIDGLDADVTTIEAARSRMEILADLAAIGYARGVGPGVYDIHSPRVPGTDEVAGLLTEATKAVPATRLWANPDCGLKTRGYAEVEPALRNLVSAAIRVRAQV